MGRLLRCNCRHARNRTRVCDSIVAEIVDGVLIIKSKHYGKEHRATFPLADLDVPLDDAAAAGI